MEFDMGMGMDMDYNWSGTLCIESAKFIITYVYINIVIMSFRETTKARNYKEFI
jgi:hypothetical protein